MSKSRKKKSRKQGVSGQTLGALALIISMVALGFSVYQFIVPPDTGPQIYIKSYDDIIWLDGISPYEYHGDVLNITYTTQVGDIVVLEFSCRLRIDPISTTTLQVNFEDNGTIFPRSQIYEMSDINLVTTGYMTYTFEAPTAGERMVVIWTNIDDEGTNSYIIDCLLTVTVY